MARSFIGSIYWRALIYSVLKKIIKYWQTFKIHMPICSLDATWSSSFQVVISSAHPWVAVSFLSWVPLPSLWKQHVESTPVSLFLRVIFAVPFPAYLLVIIYVSKTNNICKLCYVHLNFMSGDFTQGEKWSLGLYFHIQLWACYIRMCNIFFLSFTH